MSELSLDSLILNKNEVKIDESYLQKATKNQQEQSYHQSNKQSLSMHNRATLSKDIKINKNFLANRKKHSSPQSINNFNSNATVNTVKSNKQTDSHQKLYKIGIRVDAFQQNMRRMEARYGKQFFKLQQQIFKRKNDSNSIFEDLKKIRSTLDETKKNIGTVLSTIGSKNT